MFAEAGFAMVSTNAWIGNVFEKAGFEVVSRVSRLRDRLSPRDLDLFLAMPMVGPKYPGPSTNAEIIEQAEHAASAAVDGPEQWLLLGQLLSHYGSSASRSDWAARSAAALDRAIALDSSFTLAINERLFTALVAHDHDAIARFSALLEPRVGAGFTDDVFLWAASQALGDSTKARYWRDRKEGLSRTDYMQKLVRISLHSAALSLPLSDAQWANEILRRDAATTPEQLATILSNLAIRFAGGRSDLGNVDIGLEAPQWASTLIQQAMIEPSYRPVGAASIAAEEAGRYRIPARAGSVRWPPFQDCVGTLFKLSGGEKTDADGAVHRLRAFGTSGYAAFSSDDVSQVDFSVCESLIQVLAEGPPSVGEKRPTLDRLDALMQRGPRGFLGGAADFVPTAFANFTIARMREAQGDLPRALAAIRRREVDYFPAYMWSLAAFLRQEGRLAALAGDGAGAMRAYDAYLSLRTAPDAPLRPQRDSVVAERAVLLGRR